MDDKAKPKNAWGDTEKGTTAKSTNPSQDGRSEHSSVLTGGVGQTLEQISTFIPV